MQELMIFTILLGFVFMACLSGTLITAYNRVFPNGNTQTLVTKCQMNNELDKLRQKDDGYFIRDGKKVGCRFYAGGGNPEIIYVVVMENGNQIQYTILRKEYHKYPTLVELAEKVDNLSKKKKRR